MTRRQERFLQATMPASDLVHNLARRLTTCAADAEDLVQETYTRAWAAWQDGRRPRKAAPWLATICLNLGRDRLRRTANRAETSWQPGFDPPGPADVEDEAINHSLIETALRRLPIDEQIALVLMDLCGFTAAEVAAITNSPRGTVLSRAHRGRKKLAHTIEGVRPNAPRS
ncbi:RNA polymerase sigma factor [Nonomuraea sp. 10N515B]|uniref:RNA polymerase sigma factor n=1 Tax=Nonomuraea sp. 10N515B TaxID=3457422 RepID=UPI003FCEDFBD